VKLGDRLPLLIYPLFGLSAVSDTLLFETLCGPFGLAVTTAIGDFRPGDSGG
jgi:hypothetical protein